MERMTVIGMGEMASVTEIAMELLLVDNGKTSHQFHNYIRNYFHRNAYHLHTHWDPMGFPVYRLQYHPMHLLHRFEFHQWRHLW